MNPGGSSRIGAFLALLPSRTDYSGFPGTLRADLLAGTTVGIVALPLALAFGVSSGAGAAAGLATAIVAGLVAAVFGGSNVQVSGPTGAMVVVLAPIVAAHGVAAVAVVSLMAGVLVAAAGLLRLGRAVGYIPWPVIEGFTAGIGVIIFMQQVPAALGRSSEGLPENAAAAALHAVVTADWATAALPLAVVAAVAAVMILLPRVAPAIPASFAAIVLVSVATWATGAPLPTIGELPRSLPAPALPPLDLELMRTLAGSSIAVAALAAIESLLSARVAASLRDTGPVNPDRELLGQGLASIASGLFGGMPATGAIARTAVNVRSGARSRVAAIVHALLLLIVVLALANLVSVIPLSALAGVLIVTAARMVSPATIRRVLRAGRSSALVFALTLVVTVAVDLVVAVIAGLVVATVLALRGLSRASGAEREELPGDSAPGDEQIHLFRIHGSLFFGDADRLLAEVSGALPGEVVILRLSGLHLIDATGANALADLVQALERRGATVLIKGVRSEHLGLLERLGVISSLRHPNHLFDDLPAALAHARDHVRREPQRDA